MKPFVPSLQIYPEQVALGQGYLSISTTVRPDLEWEIMESMERTMQTADAVWIDYSTEKLKIYQLGRHRSQLIINLHNHGNE